jgi:hypothetical protein
VTTKDANADPVATGEGKTDATGIAQIPLFKKSGEKWMDSGSYYVMIIFDSKIMVLKEEISVTSTETSVAYSESIFDKVAEAGTLTIKNIPPASYTHILVTGTGVNETTNDFIGATLTGGSIAVSGAVANIKLFAVNDTGNFIDFPMTGSYMFSVFVDSKSFNMADKKPSNTKEMFMGAAKFTSHAATIDWATLY